MNPIPEKRRKSAKEEKEKVKCSLCDYSAIAGYRMKRHMRVHTGEKPFMCGMCDQSFTQKSSLKEHLWKHTALQSCHKCPHCNAMFNQQADVTAHITHMHTACAVPMGCTVCQEMFTDRYSLLEHEKLHDNVFRYQCLECAYSSREKKKLILHMGVHSKRRLFWCSDCKISFPQKHHLYSHLFLNHNISTFGDDVPAPSSKPLEETNPPAPQAVPDPSQPKEASKKLSSQKELEQLYQIMDEHGNTLELSEADAEAIHNAMQQSSEDGALEIIENEEGTMTVTVLTIAHSLTDGSIQDAEQNPQEIGEQNPQEIGEQNPQEIGEQNPQEISEQNPQEISEQNPQEISEQTLQEIGEQTPQEIANQEAEPEEQQLEGEEVLTQVGEPEAIELEETANTQ